MTVISLLFAKVRSLEKTCGQGSEPMPTDALVLASSSPRRSGLLDSVGLRFDIVRPETEEQRRPNEKPADYARRNAAEKAAWVLASLEPARADAVCLAADTIVVCGEDVLEKPEDRDHARRMLTRLSGATHEVLTGVCLKSTLKESLFVVATEVCFRELPPGEIEAYLGTEEPYDKAGSYAAQGRGAGFVSSIKGSYTNVVGLPLAQVLEALRNEFRFSI